jgi:3-deoxy-manno-octulosonate cytidylyltransferase (CMP-KDO synthetase)
MGRVETAHILRFVPVPDTFRPAVHLTIRAAYATTRGRFKVGNASAFFGRRYACLPPGKEAAMSAPSLRDPVPSIALANGAGASQAARVVAVLPARFASTRLPGKPLLAETGKPLIQHVVEAAREAERLERVIVATDDLRIAEAVHRFGGEAVLTRSDHPSGTDRVAEVAASLTEAEIIVNLQGDEPEISAHALNQVVELVDAHDDVAMATLATPIRSEAVYRDPSCVKVVFTSAGRALYFSRSPIPFHRDGPVCASAAGPMAYLHLGLYAYRRSFLLGLSALPPSPLEMAEKLEQLRVLEAGYAIAVGIVEEPSIGIDTPEDYRRFVERWKARIGRAG